MIVVCKLGTSTLCAGTPGLSKPRMLSLVQQVVAARALGHRLVLVSSGAVAAGRGVLGRREFGRGLPVKQMLSAVGQVRLMQQWADLFGLFDIPVGQVLLTRAELGSRVGFLNARDTIDTLLDHGVVPIVNENDALATEEIRVGDNDTLSALAANLVGADLLVLLTDIDGLFTADPRVVTDAVLIPEVSASDESLDRFAGDAGSDSGTGGMRTKVVAGRLAGSAGTPTVVANGAVPDVLVRIVAGESIGTRFLASTTRPESRKRWILGEPRVGVVSIDTGASSRLRSGGASLLPVGVVGVDGEFDRGAVVSVRCGDDPVGVGICAYGSADIVRIAGARSDQIAVRLGFELGDEVIHRDDFVLF